MNTGNSSVKQFPCHSCGANMQFHPQGGKLKCPYCGAEEAIPETAEQVQENSYEHFLSTHQTRMATLSATAMEVSCSNCGANVTFEPPHVAGDCPFCASSIVAQPKIADPVVAPEGIIPFMIGRKAARDNIQKWIAKRWFAPTALKKLAQPEKIDGVYLPFWTYDAQTYSNYTGERGEHYYVTETYTETNDKGECETKTRQVQHTRWHWVSGRVQRFFDDVLVAATTLVDNNLLNALEPWDLKQSLRPYEPSYLAGFQAQRYQVTLEEGLTLAKDVMTSQIYSDVCCDIGGDEQRVSNISTTYNSVTFKHILLPVWISAYRYQNKRYQVIVNARTGEVQGERPYSVWKITLAVLGVLAIVAIIVYFFLIGG